MGEFATTCTGSDVIIEESMRGDQLAASLYVHMYPRLREFRSQTNELERLNG